MNPEFERPKLSNLSDRRNQAIRGTSICPMCGRKYTFDTGFRRVDCECGCSFFSQTISQPDTKMRKKAFKEGKAREEAAARR